VARLEGEDPCADTAHIHTQDVALPRSNLLILEVTCEGSTQKLKTLVDTGASTNFVRPQALRKAEVPDALIRVLAKPVTVRLATGHSVEIPQKIVRLNLKMGSFSDEVDCVLLGMDDRFDLILGMPWLRRHKPQFDWGNGSLEILGSSGVHYICTTMVVSDNSIARGCWDTPESDGPASTLQSPANSREDSVVRGLRGSTPESESPASTRSSRAHPSIVDDESTRCGRRSIPESESPESTTSSRKFPSNVDDGSTKHHKM